MKPRFTDKAVAILGVIMALWLLLPPVIKVGPAQRAHIEILKRGEFIGPQKDAIEAGTMIGEDYFHHVVVPAYTWKSMPAALFILCVSSLLLSRRTQPTKENEK